MRNTFLHFINRVLHPTVSLTSLEEIERFIDPEIEFEEGPLFYKNKYEPVGDYYSRMGKRVRVLGLFHDRKEYSNELRLLKQAS